MTDHVYHGMLAVGTIAANTAAATVAIIPATELEAWGKLPTFVILAALSAWLAWLLYKQGESYRKSIDGISSSILALSMTQARLTEALHNKPCLYNAPKYEDQS
jgi:hypothetical protein